MLKVDVIRAWKDEDYYRSLSEAQRAELPAHPSGLIQLSEQDLRLIWGGSDSTVEACTVTCTRPVLVCTHPAGGCPE